MHPFKDFMQVCWVVNDLDEAMHRWQKTMNCGPFFSLRSPPVGQYHYRGKPSSLDMDVALAQAGDFQIELIQTKNDLPNAYRDSVTPGVEAFHHLGKISTDYDADYAHYLGQGFEVAQSGYSGTARFSYFDTRSALGFMVELIEEDPSIRGMFQLIADAARDWDGTDPIREITI